MWQPATERLQHFQTMLKTKLNVLTLRKEPLPTVIFHEPEAIELCTTTPLMKTRTHTGCKVTYLGKVSTTGMQFLSGCTEKPVIELWKKHTLTREDVYPANALLEIRPFQVWLHHLDLKDCCGCYIILMENAGLKYNLRGYRKLESLVMNLDNEAVIIFQIDAPKELLLIQIGAEQLLHVTY
ncbi:PTB-containing, cubilin and LRP1-interacting protein isoform X4 [Pithys albifrons albifrons]|uniref:PTB-containing, cubilin and LRP1-interacting protein isoform X4 n=1 Tax=Pithys albifrons albifrons TaxID=3385563 RepID=UPI003A5CDD4A